MIYSPPDIALILGIALLVFGPKRLPELGHAIGQGIGNFKKSLNDAETATRAPIATATTVPVAANQAPAAAEPAKETASA
jgi:sec-independent protein translocase protein TatA